MIYDNKALAHCFFGNFSRAEASTKIPCKACGKNIKKPKSGYTAFLSHVDSQHNDVKESSYATFMKLVVKKHGPMNKFVPMRSVTKFTEKLFPWMDWIIMGDLPLSWCEDKYARKYSNISAGISRKTLAKYIDLAFVDLKKQIKEDLPPTFGIIFDGWTCDSKIATNWRPRLSFPR